MATEAHAEHDDHGHGHHGGPDHVPHILPYRVYFATFGALMFLTVVTVVASRFDFGPLNLAIALAIAITKATVVAAIFMHLKYDLKFHSLMVVSSLVFLGIFVAFTMFDTEFRGRAELIESERAYDVKKPFIGTRTDAAERYRHNLPPLGTAIPTAVIAPPGAEAAPTALPTTAPTDMDAAPKLGEGVSTTPTAGPGPGDVPPGAPSTIPSTPAVPGRPEAGEPGPVRPEDRTNPPLPKPPER